MGQEPTKLTPEQLKNREIQRVDSEMRKRLGKGVHYNSKY